MSATITTATIFEDAGASLMARVLGNAGTAITQASLSSISYKVFDLHGDTPTTATQTGTLTISAVVYDTLQTSDPRWTVDTTGYNFLYTAPASWFPDAPRTYRVELKFTPATGEVFWLVYELKTKVIYSS